MFNLDAAYALIPPFPCKQGCTRCCGLVPWHPGEEHRLTQVLAARHDRVVDVRTWDYLKCPYCGPSGCTVYEVRPLWCRLMGITEGLLCPELGPAPGMIRSGWAKMMQHAYADSMGQQVFARQIRHLHEAIARAQAKGNIAPPIAAEIIVVEGDQERRVRVEKRNPRA